MLCVCGLIHALICDQEVEVKVVEEAVNNMLETSNGSLDLM